MHRAMGIRVAECPRVAGCGSGGACMGDMARPQASSRPPFAVSRLCGRGLHSKVQVGGQGRYTVVGRSPWAGAGAGKPVGSWRAWGRHVVAVCGAGLPGSGAGRSHTAGPSGGVVIGAGDGGRLRAYPDAGLGVASLIAGAEVPQLLEAPADRPICRR